MSGLKITKNIKHERSQSLNNHSKNPKTNPTTKDIYDLLLALNDKIEDEKR